MDSNYENAMVILKAMVERSRLTASNGDVISRITNLKCDEINKAMPCLEEMNLVRTLSCIKKFHYDFYKVTLAPEGYRYYDENFGKIKSID